MTSFIWLRRGIVSFCLTKQTSFWHKGPDKISSVTHLYPVGVNMLQSIILLELTIASFSASARILHWNPLSYDESGRGI